MPKPDELVLRAAWLYYVDDRNQEEIARNLAVSRPTVSRLLRRARQDGVVEIRVRATLPEAALQERQLLTAFDQLNTAIVVPESPTTSARTAVARAGAQVVEDLVLEPGMTLAVGWGRTMGEMAKAVRPRPTDQVRVCDAVGHAPEIPGATSLEVTRRLADAVGAEAVHLPTPAMLRPVSAAQMLTETDQVRSALTHARTAPVAVVSLGAATADSPLIRPGLLTSQEWESLMADGVVGDVLGHFLDDAGHERQPADVAWIGLSLDDLRAKERVIGLVEGEHRAKIAAVAVRAGLITDVITDSAAVPALLDEAASIRTPV